MIENMHIFKDMRRIEELALALGETWRKVLRCLKPKDYMNCKNEYFIKKVFNKTYSIKCI